MRSLSPANKRSFVIVLAAVLMLSACAAPGSGPPLTPAQLQLQQANQRFQQTVGEGAVLGAVVLGAAGAGLGYLAGGPKGALKGGVIGAAAGAALGASYGYHVAWQNYNNAKTEENLKGAIAAANEDAAAYQKSADASRQIAADARTSLVALNQQYRNKAITAAQLRQSESSYRDSSATMDRQIDQMKKEVIELRQTASSESSANKLVILQNAQRIEASQKSMEQSRDSLLATLALAPA
jgi:hypothetical protein